MQMNHRLIKGIFIPPLVGIVVYTVMGYFFDVLFPVHEIGEDIVRGPFGWVLLLFGGLIFICPCVLIFGTPILFALKKLYLKKYWIYSLCGIVWGILFYYISITVQHYDYKVKEVVLYGLIGLFSFLTFWLTLIKEKQKDS